MLSLEVDMKFKRSREKRKQPEELQRRRLDRGSVEYRRRSLIIFKLHRLFCLRESLPFFFPSPRRRQISFTLHSSEWSLSGRRVMSF